jgi:hypothetical protein
MHPAYNAVTWSFTSDHYQPGQAYSVATVDNNGGFTRFNQVAASPAPLVGDYITGSTFTNTLFNVTKMLVTGVSSGAITTNLAWVTGMATDTGTITNDNDSFQLKCEVQVGGVTIGTKYAEADSTTVFTFDISGILQSQLTEDILALATTALTTNNTGSVCHYTLIVTEQYEDATNLIHDEDHLDITTIGGADILAYNWAKQDDETFADYILVGADDKFLTDRPDSSILLHTDYMQLSFITTTAEVFAYIRQYAVGGSMNDFTIPAASHVDVIHGRAIIPLTVSTINGAGSYLTVVLKNGATGSAVISETRTFYVDHKEYYKVSTLMFKNHYGAFDTYSFIDRTIYINNKRDLYFDETTEKTHYIDVNETWELKGRYETTAMLTWLQELYTSKVIYLIEGTALTRVNITSTKNTVEDRDPFQPVIEIKKQPLKLN